MRRLFAIALIALLVGVGIVVIIQTDPGYVLVAYGNYTLESSLWVGLLLLALFIGLVFFLLRLIYRIAGGQRSLFSWLDARKTRNAQRLTSRGLLSFIEGNWLNARRELLRLREFFKRRRRSPGGGELGEELLQLLPLFLREFRAAG